MIKNHSFNGRIETIVPPEMLYLSDKHKGNKFGSGEIEQVSYGKNRFNGFDANTYKHSLYGNKMLNTGTYIRLPTYRKTMKEVAATAYRDPSAPNVLKTYSLYTIFSFIEFISFYATSDTATCRVDNGVVLSLM